ncbi:hypothetical protein [Microbacterium binotii]|uniref:hypothetical protein n=1 Tax=Microbacterium binotii TaxID=462710 RepID=UPI001F317FBE|nr:hypothetical protein [Microbacterium binotii]UIN30928.1 hypothetical protein LXM64_01595 [Microbacterium binotii]
MNMHQEQFFHSIELSDESPRRCRVDIGEREIVASVVRPGEWTLNAKDRERVGRVLRRQEGRATYFVGFAASDPEIVEFVSDDVDRVVERLVMVS